MATSNIGLKKPLKSIREIIDSIDFSKALIKEVDDEQKKREQRYALNLLKRDFNR